MPDELARLFDRHRRAQERARADLAPAAWGPPYEAPGGGTAATRVWVKVVIVYDDIDPPTTAKHPSYGRCLGVKVATLTFPTPPGEGEPPSDLTWSIPYGAAEVIAFADPIVLDALDQARADPDGLGEAIHLDDYYEIDQLYKAETASGHLVVGREPFALIGGPSYEAP